MSGEACVTGEQPISKLAVIHWFPVEQFPPVQNLLTTVSGCSHVQCCCLTTVNDRGLRDFSGAPVSILRRPFPSRQLSRLRRLWLLLSFPIWAAWQLFWFRPDSLLYFEPHSSAAAFLYLVFNRRCRLLIHYHEYRELREYRDRGNRLFGWYHVLERWLLYRRAVWISHTNADRVRLFLQDTPEAAAAQMRVLPNYPPASWQRVRRASRADSDPLRLIYIGAASIKDTFIGEVVEWVSRQAPDSLTLTVYINNSDPETEQMLQRVAAINAHVTVNLRGVPYQQLPQLLCQFDVGLVLYRGNTPNYVYNAPNKLFEYLACGLDVWYPGCMLGVRPYARSDVRPQILETDFQRLSELDWQARISPDLPHQPWQGSSEAVLQPLLQAAAGE